MAELPKVIYVMGPPGAGKGTQAELIAQELGYHRFSTGDAFRAIIRKDTPLGKKIKEIVEGGLLCPPELAAEVVIDAIKKFLGDGHGLIFDGTPRTVKEAEMVDEFFAKNGYGRPLAIHLSVTKETMIERNSKRRFCLDIEGDFPINHEEDTKRCEELGGRVGKRADDAPEKFEVRWTQFLENTKPVIEKYKKEGILSEVDGKKTIEEVHQEVVEVIDRVRST